ncbi:MAG: N-acetyl sugar amidotransferase [Deltaproteobacteria bacterium]|nr:N-acetyl sugar amidotransferase [Deltaproteobacteria bacterium]
MDTSDPDITFDWRGICNHCRRFDFAMRRRLNQPKSNRELEAEMIERVGRAKGKYNCVIGLSGGADSSYLAYLVKREYGFRPLAVHLDNGWNSRLAVRNIQRIVKKLEIEMITHVIDWEEFRDLQRSYFKASVVDIEATTDHAINAILFETAAKYGIDTLLMGTNIATEHIMPKSWFFVKKNDLSNLLDIHARFGSVPLKTFPTMGREKLRRYRRDLDIRSYSPLNWRRYVKDEVKKVLADELGWKDYGGKHYESLFTKLYQGYFLIDKFGIDKRRAHLSTLVKAGQLTRDQALEELETPAYPPEELEHDLDFMLKKLGFSREEFDEILRAEPRSHLDYACDVETRLKYHFFYRLHPFYRQLVRQSDRARAIVSSVRGGAAA